MSSSSASLLRRALWLAMFLLPFGLPALADGTAPARSMIFMIGDGMGPGHIQLTSDFAGRQLAMQTLPVNGLATTRSASSPVTDSAAAGTALACGHKTNNGMLGQLPDGTALKSIAEQARDAGKRVGLLTSMPINHATPAAFYANVESRNSYYPIGLQAFDTRFQVLGGGSLADADGANVKPRPEDSLWKVAEKAGYTLARTPSELAAPVAPDGKLLIVPGSLHAESGVPYGRPLDPAKHITLAQMTTKALEVLDNEAGFFLMVEGGAIDTAAHGNDAVRMVAETLAFDEAVGVAKAFVEAHPDTLLIVTSDHETGGLTFLDGYAAEKARAVLGRQRAKESTAEEELKAKTSGAANLTWDEACQVLASSLGVDGKDLSSLEPAYQALLAASDKDQDKAMGNLLKGAAKLRDQAAGLAWTTTGHTGVDVRVFAMGAGADRFAGPRDNTSIPAVGCEVLGLPALP